MSRAPRKPLRSTREGADIHRDAARRGFFQAIEDVAPHVGGELVEKVAPPFMLLAEHLEATRGHPSWANLDRLRTAPSRLEKATAEESSEARERIMERCRLQVDLLKALDGWAGRYHRGRDTWILDYALRHLERVWRFSKAEGIDSPPALGDAGPPISYAYRTRPAPTYEPPHESRADYLERIHAYVEDVEKEYRAAGWEDTPHRPHGLTHLRWLVRHQCLALPYHECGRVDPSNIRKAIQELSALLPLTLRPAPGRRIR